MKEREAYFIVIIGRPGCGKSTTALKFIETLGKQKCLIVDPDGLEKIWYQFQLIDGTNAEQVKNLTGIKKSFSPGKKKVHLLFNNLYNNFRNGLLVLDDCRVYVNSNADDSLEDMLRRKRQMMSDIITMTHCWTETPPIFFRFATHFILFATDEPIESRKHQINNFEKMKAIKEHVDKESARNKHYNVMINVSKLNSQ